MSLPKINRALEEVGNLLDRLNDAHNSLPNEYTRGELEGARKSYKTILDVLQTPVNEQQPDSLEDPYFLKGPRTNPQYGNMVKYGDHDPTQQTWGSDGRVAQTVADRSGFTLADVVSELYMIRTTLQENVVAVVEDIIASRNTPDAPNTQDISQAARESLNAQEKVDQAFGQDISTRTARAWDQTLGERLRGEDVADVYVNYDKPEQPKQTVADYERELHGQKEVDEPSQPTLPPPIVPEDEEFVDMETGERYKQRTIGGRINVDDDDEPGDRPVRSWAEYQERENAKSLDFQDPTPRVYTPKHPSFNELEDLGPGQT